MSLNTGGVSMHLGKMNTRTGEIANMNVDPDPLSSLVHPKSTSDISEEIQKGASTLNKTGQERSPKDKKGGLNEKALSVVNRVKEKLTGMIGR